VSRGVPNYAEVVRELERQDWRVETTKRGHYRAFPPDGGDVVLFSDTEDRRGQKNALSALRRQGFVWPPPSKKDKSSARAAAPPAPRSPPSLDDLFEELKGAKAELESAQLVYAQAEQAEQEAQAKLQRAKDNLDAAERLLAETKVHFDEAFGEPS
jgi:hypothetical protein